VIVAALKRSPNELASFQKKVFKVDDHMCIGMSGLTADGRSLLK
jgi:20S proteasome subunit alpha 6